MRRRDLWARVLAITGGIAMLVGAVDPLEGSVVVLAGSGLLAVGAFVGQGGSRLRSYWIWVFVSIAVGVAAMFVLSAFGGVGGETGHSFWWCVFILPYPVGWIMGIARLAVMSVNGFRHRRAPA
jgi:hypothetical protein